METKKRLEAETRKWLERLENDMQLIKSSKLPKPTAEQMDNVYAYIEDCRYFLGKKDHINSFEAIIYAWGIYETLLRLGMIEKEK